ncbi:phosphoribosylformylglycinamidine synthase I [Thermosulfurimonas dismutans]|uniref:Phosphoribosylformylglycinamidine synthase, glutamine amidotransferase subunit n=1 Tax=Thermosulfurimonas dismutans TaxID=999894 RepID=A0A179D3Q4_9BACT|nr:phosphoribosylformylglycinamidine synthase I [Thermosulfurimonas dismutans]OAQ20714.1 Phosphoribosylformylglycinamidine synthase, glutamine amidotransferase subunit [Thermosulfurimonas dismutans]
MKPRALVLFGYGINCELETAHTLALVGAEPEIVHLSELIYGEKSLRDYHLLCFPGGFLDGDHLGAAQAAAHRLRHARIRTSGERLMDHILEFIQAGKLIIGICNGFQLLVKLGLLPGFDGHYGERLVSLTYNDSGRFEDRWVWLKVNQESPCVFTRGLKKLYFPVRHGEGKFMVQNEEVLNKLVARQQIVLQYIHPRTGKPTEEYPYNPNGSVMAIAGICDATGRIFGLMPHPEAFNHTTNHPRWTREEVSEDELGLVIFRNAVEYIQETLLS